MKNALRTLALTVALTMALGLALAEAVLPDSAQEDAVIALVNGEALTASAYTPFEISYLTNYASLGYDITDESIKAYVQDLALTAAIEDMLICQDMTAQGFFNFDEETESWLIEQGTAAYEAALIDVGETIRDTLNADAKDDMSAYAQAYAQVLGVTAEDYIDVYRTQYARMMYYAWLTEDWPVTDEDIQAAFEAQDDASIAESELTQALRDALAYDIYTERCQQRLNERVDALAGTADVTLY